MIQQALAVVLFAARFLVGSRPLTHGVIDRPASGFRDQVSELLLRGIPYRVTAGITCPLLKIPMPGEARQPVGPRAEETKTPPSSRAWRSE